MSSVGGRHTVHPAPVGGNICSASTLRSRRLATFSACQVIALAAAASAFGQSMAPQSRFADGFDGPRPSWRIATGQSTATLLTHTRSTDEFRAGGGSERVRFSTGNGETVRLVHDLPPALAFDEFSASIWVKSNRKSAMLALRVRFPHAIDPRTDQPLTLDVLGDPYTAPQQWQELTCPTTAAAIQRSLVRLRSQQRQFPAGVQLDTREAYVDEVAVIVELQPGTTEVYVDELAAGPIITPATTSLVGSRRDGRGNHEPARVLIGDDQLRLNGSPFLLRFTPYHGEPAAVLAECGINAAWIPDYTDGRVLSDLEQAGLYAIAELPLPPGIGDHSEADRLQLEPLPFSDHPRILFWNIGTRLKPEDLPDVSAWCEMVRSSDHEFARPLLGEVTGREREYHRRLDCLGASRHFLQTSIPPLSYLEFLRQKRDLGFPDKPMFTHIQTEPDPGLLRRVPSAVIEPEQIWFQGYAALATGYKGIGFWKHTPLTQDALAGDERRLAMTLFNRQLDLLEPWLASGKVTEVVPATFADPTPETRSGSGWGFQLLGGRRAETQTPDGPVRVAVLQSDAGYVLLPVWYEPDAQYQPGPMIADELYFRVAHMGDDVLQAWQVTTSDVSDSPVEVKRVELGHLVRLSGFDQHAAIIITHRMELIEELRQRIAATQESTAHAWINLADAKLRRVESVQAEFVDLGISVDHGEELLNLARQRLREAEHEFAARRFSDACRKSQRSMAVLRIFQRAHWDRAVAALTSGVSSPYAICFQTLPEHWRLMERIGRGVMQPENLLKSGDFEDRDTMLARRWVQHQLEDPAIGAESQLRRRNAAQGRYSLHLAAQRRAPGPPASTLDEPPLRWISPPVSVYAGQIVYIGGQVRIEEPLTEHPDGLLVYETLEGPLGALRWREPAEDGDWQTFQMIREVRESGELRVVMELRGLGNVSIDDIRVIAIDPPAP